MQSVGKNIWNGGKYGIEGSVITAIVLAFAIVLIWCIMYKNKRKSKGMQGDEKI